LLHEKLGKKAQNASCLKIGHVLYICPIFRRKVSMATLVRDPKSSVFPDAAVEACIRDALSDQAKDQVILRPTAVASSSSIRSWEPEIDSLVAVEIACAVEELLGIDLPPTFSPKGGYDSAEACINDLMAQAKAAWADATKEN
jgi:acyl carrier protein